MANHTATNPRADGLSEAEHEARAFHERVAFDAANLWREGLKLLNEGIEVANGQNAVPNATSVQITLLMSAIQSLFLAHRLAVQGYFPQALNLIRAPIEYQTAIHYLQLLPQEYEKFTDLGKKTPSFNTLNQGVQSELWKLSTHELGKYAARTEAERYAAQIQAYTNSV